MLSVGNVRHTRLKNGEECLYFDVTFKFASGKTLLVKGFQLFRAAVHPPKSRDKIGAYWPVFSLPDWAETEICANLRSMGLEAKHPNVAFPASPEEEVQWT